MEPKFYVNPNIDLSELHSSMQLDSNTLVASLEADGYKAVLIVNGDVRVFHNPDPKGKPSNGDLYKCPSRFPDELIQAFKDGRAYKMPNVHVSYNNWFEIYLSYLKDGVWHSDDDGPFTEDELRTMLQEYIDDGKAAYEEIIKQSA